MCDLAVLHDDVHRETHMVPVYSRSGQSKWACCDTCMAMAWRHVEKRLMLLTMLIYCEKIYSYFTRIIRLISLSEHDDRCLLGGEAGLRVATQSTLEMEVLGIGGGRVWCRWRQQRWPSEAPPWHLCRRGQRPCWGCASGNALHASVDGLEHGHLGARRPGLHATTDKGEALTTLVMRRERIGERHIHEWPYFP